MLEFHFIKVASLKDCNFIKMRLQHRYFPVNIAKILRTAFFIEQLRWLLINIGLVITRYYNVANVLLFFHVFLLFHGLKAGKDSPQNMGNSENLGHIVPGTVQ